MSTAAARVAGATKVFGEGETSVTALDDLTVEHVLVKARVFPIRVAFDMAAGVAHADPFAAHREL